MPTTTTTLTNADKLSIIDQHIKGLEFSIYGLELDMIEATAVSDTSSDQIAGITARLTSLNAKKTALLEEAATLAE
jgi:hypothetical protein